jgi:thymidylate synthase
MGFPCLSGCSFQLDHGIVHLLAHYRYEYLIQRGYGNYLGLARLLNYVATSAGLIAGQMTIVTGRAHVDAPEKALRRRLYPTLLDGA